MYETGLDREACLDQYIRICVAITQARFEGILADDLSFLIGVRDVLMRKFQFTEEEINAYRS